MRRLIAVAVLGLCAAAPLEAKEHPALTKARALYNAADYDGAIGAASMALADPASADASALVVARSHLERYRVHSDAADLSMARAALAMVHVTTLAPRDQVDLLIGLGQALYFGGSYGAAAELFDTALGRGTVLSDADRLRLLDWWVTAVDRNAQLLPVDRRNAILERALVRMDDELRLDPGSPVANYWLAAGARDSGDLDRAWYAAVAAWVRAPLRPATAMTLRTDIDRFVTEALIPERSRRRPQKEQSAALEELRAEWDMVKSDWK
jgi:hypothetical protein